MEGLRAWLALHRTPGVGPVLFRELLGRFGSPARALAEAGRPGAGDSLGRKGLADPDWSGVDADLAWAEQPGNAILTLVDSRYPRLLREIPDPPPLLYLHGVPEVLALPQVAVVGSRNPSPVGQDNARHFARSLAAVGLGVTSGMAYGIDAASHLGALEVGGVTVAVAGTGLDRVYPARHRELAHRIAERGALVSEYPLGTPPLPGNFPRRNRIIAGLSLGTLVVEAAPHSGSLITARLALDQGREVFAIPGSIHNPLARGCHALIRQGAKLVESAGDILEELGPLARVAMAAVPDPPSGAEPELDKDQRLLLECLGFDAAGVDILVERSGLTPEVVSSILLILELRGLVAAQPGGLYTRATRG